MVLNSFKSRWQIIRRTMTTQQKVWRPWSKIYTLLSQKELFFWWSPTEVFCLNEPPLSRQLYIIVRWTGPETRPIKDERRFVSVYVWRQSSIHWEFSQKTFFRHLNDKRSQGTSGWSLTFHQSRFYCFRSKLYLYDYVNSFVYNFRKPLNIDKESSCLKNNQNKYLHENLSFFLVLFL